jgi:hypothetical protein
MSDDEAPGWHAIDTALEAVYGDQQPKHYGTIIKGFLGGSDPIDGISVYRSKASRPHWHYVTYGYSELYKKEADDKEVSGFGLEMTFRLARTAKEKEPPIWPLSFLQNLARYVFQTGNVFQAGHHMNLNGPIALEEDTEIRAAMFALDPELQPIQTPHGRVQFLQVVGVTADELEAAELWKTSSFLDILARTNPLLITDLRRTSIPADPTLRREMEQGSKREGSSTHGIFVTAPRWKEKQAGTKKQLRLTLGATAVARLPRLLLARLIHGQDFCLWSSERSVRFKPADKPGWKAEDDCLTIRLPTALVEQLQTTLVPKRGLYFWDDFNGFTLDVVPSEIKDGDGNVVEVVG